MRPVLGKNPWNCENPQYFLKTTPFQNPGYTLL
jgi:hypothetical protein